MKKILLLTLNLVLFHCFAQSKKKLKINEHFEVLKCVSGDCQNGEGEAQFKFLERNVFDPNDSVTYVGSFKNGEISGEGILYNSSSYYKGSFQNNYFFGNGTKYYSKKEGDKTVPNLALLVSFYLWDDDGCYESRGLDSEDSAFRSSESGYLYKRHKNFCPDFDSFNTDWVKQQVKLLQATNTKIYSTEVVSGDLITHSIKDMNLSMGSYSVAFTQDMLGTLPQGYKKYYVSVDLIKYAKKYHAPSGTSFFYQLINDKNEVVNQQIIQSDITSNACYFEVVPEGKYTIQIAYDYHTCLGDCEKLEGLKLQVRLCSYDYTYRKFMKN